MDRAVIRSREGGGSSRYVVKDRETAHRYVVKGNKERIAVQWNQMFDKGRFYSSRTLSGVTYTNNGDGSYNVNGTANGGDSWATFTPAPSSVKGHKYLLRGAPSDGAITTYFIIENNGILSDTGSGSIGTATYTLTSFAIVVCNGKSINNKIFRPVLFDLTQLFGSGNEPTSVQQFEQWLLENDINPNEYIPYNAGETKYMTKPSWIL